MRDRSTHRCLEAAAVTLAVILAGPPAGAQQIVIDPSQIAASATNSADQIDFMIDQLGELTSLGDKLKGVKDYVDDVFGEDGIGGKAISMMEDLGTLQRLTDAFNSSIRSFDEYSAYIRSSGKYGLSEANSLLMYLSSARRNADMAVEVARKILSTLGLTKKEKKDEIEKITQELEAQQRIAEEVISMEMKTSLAAEGFCQFIDALDKEMDPHGYIESARPLGTLSSSVRTSMSLVSLLLGLLGVVSIIWAFISYLRGSALGDSSADFVFLRLGAALMGGCVILEVLGAILD